MVFAAQGGVARLVSMLSAPEGMPQSLTTRGAPVEMANWPTDPMAIQARQAPPDINEKQRRVLYPSVSIYCDKIENRLTEKYRRFSGTLRYVIEVRVAGDRLETLQDELHLQTEAVLDTLERNRGDLGDGLFWSGAYEVTFGAVKHGGPNYLQTAKVICELTLSRE